MSRYSGKLRKVRSTGNDIRQDMKKNTRFEIDFQIPFGYTLIKGRVDDWVNNKYFIFDARRRQ
jgi:hypothetical protein